MDHRPPPPKPPSNSNRNVVATSAGIGGVAGGIAGLAWGGVGGRIAMRVLFLTSHGVDGRISDDGFEIGLFSPATVFLLVFASVVGTVGGLAFGLLRVWLRGPRLLVAIGLAIAASAVAGGGFLVHDEGIDFRLLGPLWLSVGLFMFIPAAWGVTVVWLTDRLLRPGTVFATIPPAIDDDRGALAGAAAWLVLAVLTALGIADLMSDLAALT